jgi:uncharacterized protein
MVKPCLTLQLLEGTLAVCRLGPRVTVPEWALAAGPFGSVTRTPEELSIVCPEHRVPPDVQCEKGWRALKVQGPLDFGLTGILDALTDPLARSGVSIFAVSTFDTDYLLVREACLEEALAALRAAGHSLGAA